MKEFKREDYIYLKLIDDYEDKDEIKYKKGEILRYRKEWLIENIIGRQFGNIFDYDNELIYEKMMIVMRTIFYIIKFQFFP